MSCYNLSDDEPLGIPSMLPSLTEPQVSPTSDSVNMLDMIRQDVMLGNGVQSSRSSASTEVTYASQYPQYSQYTVPSAVPYTSAGDVFLPTIPITTISNTFIRPPQTYYTATYPNRTVTTNFKPYAWPASPRSPNQIAVNPFVLDDDQAMMSSSLPATSLSEPSTSKSSSARSRNSSSKSRGSSSRSRGSSSKSRKSSSRSRKSSSRSRSSSSRSRRSSSRCRDSPSKSRSSRSKPRTSPTKSQRSPSKSRSSSSNSQNSSEKSSNRSQSSPSPHSRNKSSSRKSKQSSSSRSKGGSLLSNNSPPQSGLVPPSTSAGSSRSPAATHTITQAANTTSKSTVCIVGTITTLAQTANLRVTPCTWSSFKTPAAPSVTSSRAQFSPSSIVRTTYHPNLTLNSVTKRPTPLSIISPMEACYRQPANITYPTPTIITRVPPGATSAPQSPALTESVSAIPATATDQASQMDSYNSLVRPRSLLINPMTPTRRLLANVCGRPSVTTPTITCNAPAKPHVVYSGRSGRKAPVVVAHTQSSTLATAGVGSHTLSNTSDSTPRPRNQFLLSLANNQTNTSTSLGYLVTPPLGSEIIPSRNAAVSSQSVTSCAAPSMLGAHTITTISHQALNKLRNSLLSANNVPSTASGLRSISPSMSIDANRTRGPVTILSNQLISAVHTRDGSGTLASSGASNMASTRTLFSGTPTQGLYTFTTAVTSHSSSINSAEPAASQVNQMVMLPNVHASSNSVSSAPTTQPQTAILLASTAPTEDTTRPSRMTYAIPILHSSTITATTALSSMTTATSSFLEDAEGSASRCLPICFSDTNSKLRNRLILQVTTVESTMPDTTSPITYAASRTRAQKNIFTISARSMVYAPSTRTSDATSKSPSMTVITLATTTADTPTSNSPQRHMLSASYGNPAMSTTVYSITTATPTLTSTGNRVIIKLATPNVMPATCTVTTTVTTPITTAAVSPPEHAFIEPHPVSRPRTFPGPRTYSVAQRSAAGGAQRIPGTSVSPRAVIKRNISSPGPLQIFADVVCPPANTQPVPVITPAHPRPRFTLSQSPGSSTLVVPQYKDTVFKNVSTVAHTNNPERQTRFLIPRSAAERLVLNRSVAMVPPLRRADDGTPLPSPSPPPPSPRTFERSVRVPTSQVPTPVNTQVVSIDLPSSPDNEDNQDD